MAIWIIYLSNMNCKLLRGQIFGNFESGGLVVSCDTRSLSNTNCPAKAQGGREGDVSWRPTNVSRLLMPAAVTSLISGFSSRLWGDSPPWYRGAPLTFGGILGDTFANTQNFYLIHFPHSHSEHITRYCDIQTGEKCSNNWVKNVPSARYSHLRTVLPDRGPVNSKWVGEPD